MALPGGVMGIADPSAAMKRSLVHLALIVSVLDPVAVSAKAWTRAGHGCSDHVCMCSRSCPPRRSAQQPCEASAAQIRGACHHDEAVLQAPDPAILPPQQPRALPEYHEFAALAPGHAPRSGFARIDPQPPRSR